MAMPVSEHDRPRAQAAPTRRRFSVGGALALLLVVLPGAAGKAAAMSPEQFIRELADRALRILEARKDDRRTRLAELEKLLEQATDLDLIARLALGVYWRKATPEQRRRYLELFRQLVRKQLARAVDEYKGIRIRVVSSTPVSKRDTMVNTLVERSGGDPPFHVDWRVRRTRDGRYVIIDVVTEGISMLQTRREEMREIAGSKGIDGLLAALEREVQGDGRPEPARG